jgi:hypothetical protein
VVAACGVLSPQEQLLTDFFEASRLYDTTVVAKMSDVIFNPREDGVVQDFEVEKVEPAADGMTERVTVRANVRRPDGTVSARTLVASLRRQDGRWFISRLDGAP